MTQFHSDKFNVVRLLDSFTYRGQLCLEFEKLDMNLSQFVQRNHNHVLDLTLIRPLVQQVGVSHTSQVQHRQVKGDLQGLSTSLSTPLSLSPIVCFSVECY